MKLPEIDLEELEKLKEQNFRERLEFQDRYVRWLKATCSIKVEFSSKSNSKQKIYRLEPP